MMLVAVFVMVTLHLMLIILSTTIVCGGVAGIFIVNNDGDRPGPLDDAIISLTSGGVGLWPDIGGGGSGPSGGRFGAAPQVRTSSATCHTILLSFHTLAGVVLLRRIVVTVLFDLAAIIIIIIIIIITVVAALLPTIAATVLHLVLVLLVVALFLDEAIDLARQFFNGVATVALPFGRGRDAVHVPASLGAQRRPIAGAFLLDAGGAVLPLGVGGAQLFVVVVVRGGG